MADDAYEPDTSTPGLTVAWFDKHESFGILHAPSRLAIAKGWGHREDAITTADHLDGMLPWAATAAKLQDAPREAVTDVAYVVSEGGGTFLTHPEVGGGSDA
ncbi:hypothetical protein OG216_09955 [Streptomycetaceae bacterium NBC_01309]